MATKTSILLFGASGHAKVVLDILRRQNLYTPVGVVVASWNGEPTTMLGLPVLGTDDEIQALARAEGIETGLVAVGDNFVREKIANKIQSVLPSFRFATAIHPSAQIAEDVKVGEGTVVMAGAVINSGTSIGRFCIVNSSASIDHDNSLEDFVSLGPGVVTGGNVTMRHGAVIGLGAHILQGIEVGEHALAGAGALVLKSLSERCVAVGAPAHVIKNRQPGDPYL